MFTGIIETLGEVVDIHTVQKNVEIYISSIFSTDLKIDQSIAHNGVCLTVDQTAPSWHRCTLIAETLDKSNFNNLQKGDLVNLERSVIIGSRLDGHFVQGHVDTTTTCLEINDSDGSWVYKFSLPSTSSQLVVPKGSITINGVSLTISDLKEAYFEVSIIPYTFHHTNFHKLRPGDLVNIEFDILGKYIHRIWTISGLPSIKL